MDIKQKIKDIIKTDDFGQYLPEFLYHATFSGTLDSIKKNGLGSFKSGYKSLWNLQYEQGVYLDTDASSAESFVEGSNDDRLDTEDIIVFKIPTARLDPSLLEVDWNNTWNTDIIEDGDLTSLEQYFDSITYFYGGVIPFADLAMIESLNEEQEDDIELEPIAPTKENIIKLLEDSSEEFLITSSIGDINTGDDFYILPDGRMVVTNLYDEDTMKIYRDHSFVDKFLVDIGMTKEPIEDRSLFFEKVTGSVAIDDGTNHLIIILNSTPLTPAQYKTLETYIVKSDSDKDFVVIEDGKMFKDFHINSQTDRIVDEAKTIINVIKEYYITRKMEGSRIMEANDVDVEKVELIKEDINHEEVYDSLTFSNEPDKGPIFISDDGMFVNIGKLSFHSKIFNGKDYEADDYYFLNDEYDLIKANGGNRFEPFAYIDLWKTPNPAQKKAIISWMYYLIEWGMYTLQVNTSSSNETYNLTNKIPEEVYDEITRGLLESKNEDVGYRNDDYFGDGKRSLLKVIVHETTELGNIDIPDTVLSTFKHTEEQGKLLKEFIELIDSGDPVEDFDVYIETLMDVIHGEYPEAKYALWLCKTKDDVKKLYGGTDSNIGTYKIEYPKPISDLGEEGLLYVFSKVPTLING